MDTKEELQAQVAAQAKRIAELERALAGLEGVERSRAEAVSQLQQQQEFARVLLEHLADGVVACDAEGTLVLFNHTARQWHGVDVRRVAPHEWATYYDLFEYDGVTPLPVEGVPLFRAFQGEHVRNARMAIAAKGQPIRYLLTDGDPLFDMNGRKVGAVVVMHDITDRKRTEEEAQRRDLRREAMIRAQAEALAELSTPLIPISEDIVVMPLIGLVDPQRAEQVVATLLRGIGERRAKTAILDVTGISTADSGVADVLMRSARAARLLGAQVIVTGIRAEMAQHLVTVDVDMKGLMTCSSLQSGIAVAMGRR